MSETQRQAARDASHQYSAVSDDDNRRRAGLPALIARRAHHVIYRTSGQESSWGTPWLSLRASAIRPSSLPPWDGMLAMHGLRTLPVGARRQPPAVAAWRASARHAAVPLNSARDLAGGTVARRHSVNGLPGERL
jgi:hypothetical protein